MKVILLSELKGKGGEGDVIDVADGFANNWLLPQKIAIKATEGNLKQLEQKRNNIAKREVVRLAEANEKATQLEGKVVRIEARLGDEGQLFGSVTNVQISEAIQAQLGLEVDRHRIDVRPIKEAGSHAAVVSLYREIVANIEVQVNDAAGFAAIDAAAAAETEQVEETEATEEAAE